MKSSVKGLAVALLVAGVSFCGLRYALAAEHGGKEHGGMEEEAPAVAEPSADDIKGTMKEHVDGKIKEEGAFKILDEKTGEMRELELVRVHDRVGKTGDYYYSCADFKDKITGENIDVDIDVENAGGKLGVADVRIHKVEGKERYTYDQNDNRIPVNE